MYVFEVYEPFDGRYRFSRVVGFGDESGGIEPVVSSVESRRQIKPPRNECRVMSDPAVLLVEDSGFMATHTAGTLESIREMTVRTVETAEEARKRLREDDIDCLVVNTQLPDENGINFVRSVRSDPDLSAVPTLLFTSGDLEAVATEAFDAGVIDVVSKNHHAGDSMEVFANRIEVVIDAFEQRQAD